MRNGIIDRTTWNQFGDQVEALGGDGRLIDGALAKRHHIYNFLRALRMDDPKELIRAEADIPQTMFPGDRFFGTKDAREQFGIELDSSFSPAERLVRQMKQKLQACSTLLENFCLYWIPNVAFEEVLSRLPPGFCRVFDKKDYTNSTDWMKVKMRAGFRLLSPGPLNGRDDFPFSFRQPSPAEIAYFTVMYWQKRKNLKFVGPVMTVEGPDNIPVYVHFHGWDPDPKSERGLKFDLHWREDDPQINTPVCHDFLLLY